MGLLTKKTEPVKAEQKMVNFTPRNKRILVEQPDAEKKTNGGIIIPDQLQVKPNQGKIIALDPAIEGYKAGDHILFHSKAGFPLHINGEELLMINELEVFMSYELQ